VAALAGHGLPELRRHTKEPAVQQDNAIYDPKVHETIEVEHKGRKARKRIFAARLADYEATGWTVVAAPKAAHRHKPKGE